jgi:hypothetical protein
MTTAASVHGARLAGLATGLAIVAFVAWHAWSVPPTEARQGLGVALRAIPTGELSVDPAKGDVLRASDLRPGGKDGAARGLLHIRNLTGRKVAVRPQIDGGDPELDEALHLEITRRGRRVFRGPAGALRAGRARSGLNLEPGELAGVRVRAFVPASVPDTALGRSAELTISFDAQLAR